MVTLLESYHHMKFNKPLLIKAARLLTLAGFLHFYGLNNGYTCSVMVSNMDAGRSLGVVHFAVKDFCGRFTASMISRPLEGLRGWIVQSTLGFQSAVRKGFSRDSGPAAGDPAFCGDRSGGENRGSWTAEAGDSLRYSQENCIKESKDNWISKEKCGKEHMGSRIARFKVKGLELSAASAFGIGRQVFWRYRTLLRHLALKSGHADEDGFGRFYEQTRARRTRHALTGFLLSLNPALSLDGRGTVRVN